MINDYIVYLILAFTVTAIPGPAVVLTIKNSHRYGYKSSIANICGNFVAMVLLAILSAVGLGAIILSSATLYAAIKLIGCLYLVYLGIKAWTAPPMEMDLSQQTARPSKSFIALFREGVGVGLSNPKAIAFFTALFPQFIDPTRNFIPQFLTLILTIEGVSFLVLSSYALLASWASPFLTKGKAMAAFNKLTGAAFVGFGAALVFDE